MPPLEPTTDPLAANNPWHWRAAELDLAHMSVKEEDWQEMRISEDELVAMAPTVDEVLTMTDADWRRLRLPQGVLSRLRDDLMRRMGVCAQDLTWLSRAIERGQDGHPRSQTGTD